MADVIPHGGSTLLDREEAWFGVCEAPFSLAFQQRRARFWKVLLLSNTNQMDYYSGWHMRARLYWTLPPPISPSTAISLLNDNTHLHWMHPIFRRLPSNFLPQAVAA